jgi:hypothetical protein
LSESTIITTYAGSPALGITSRIVRSGDFGRISLLRADLPALLERCPGDWSSVGSWVLTAQVASFGPVTGEFPFFTPVRLIIRSGSGATQRVRHVDATNGITVNLPCDYVSVDAIVPEELGLVEPALPVELTCSIRRAIGGSLTTNTTYLLGAGRVALEPGTDSIDVMSNDVLSYAPGATYTLVSSPTPGVLSPSASSLLSYDGPIVRFALDGARRLRVPPDANELVSTYAGVAPARVGVTAYLGRFR